jgi:hypothetical protein
VKNENAVKAAIKDALKEHAWKSWPITQTGYGVAGVSDRIAVKAGVFLAVEAKFYPKKPTELQKRFLREVREARHFAFVVDDRTLDVFRDFLDAFDLASEAASRHQDADDETKACLIQSVALLSAPYLED